MSINGKDSEASGVAPKILSLTTLTDGIKFALLIGTVLAVLVGAVFAHFSLAPYGLDFFEYAEIDDYLRIALRHWIILFLVVYVLLSSNYYAAQKSKNDPLWKRVIAWLVFLAIPLVLLVVAFDRYQEKIEYSEKVRQKSGFGKQVIVQYGRPIQTLDCAFFLAKAGDFTHFWDSRNERLESITSTHIISISKKNLSCMASETLEKSTEQDTPTAQKTNQTILSPSAP